MSMIQRKTSDIQLSSAAIRRFQQELTKNGKSKVRLSVKEAGCSGFEYVLNYADQASDTDLIQVFEGFELLVDAKYYDMVLKGLKIDYQQDLLSSSFVFHNPNKKGECGCGLSFTV